MKEAVLTDNPQFIEQRCKEAALIGVDGDLILQGQAAATRLRAAENVRQAIRAGSLDGLYSACGAAEAATVDPAVIARGKLEVIRLKAMTLDGVSPRLRTLAEQNASKEEWVANLKSLTL